MFYAPLLHISHFKCVTINPKFPLNFSGIRTFQEWNRYRYGVFPEIGFKNDPLYPFYWQVGPQKVKNEGCNTTFSFEDYNNTENVRLMVRLLEPILVRFSPLKCWDWPLMMSKVSSDPLGH